MQWYDLTLTNKTRLEEQNFIFRLVYKDSYWTEPNFAIA